MRPGGKGSQVTPGRRQGAFPKQCAINPQIRGQRPPELVGPVHSREPVTGRQKSRGFVCLRTYGRGPSQCGLRSRGEANHTSRLLSLLHHCASVLFFPEFCCFSLQLSSETWQWSDLLTPQPRCQLPLYIQIQPHHNQKGPVPQELSKKKIWSQIPTTSLGQ